MRNDRLEYWMDEEVFLAIDSSHQPQLGELVSIRDQTYEVLARNFTVDHADDWEMRQSRLAVTIQPVGLLKPTKQTRAKRWPT